MATGIACPVPILQFLANDGSPLSGGSVLTQVGGVNQATYQDPGLATALPNPIPLNSRGEISSASGASQQCFLTPGIVYTFTIYDAEGNQVDQAQYVGAAAVSTGWGTPTGAAVQNDYSGSSATLAETSAALAELITALKALGILGS